MKKVDALGREHTFAAPPGRIVSLVPSLTETLFALGAGERVVGVTEYCVHPAEAVADLPKLGGTKNPNVSAIAALEPDLVIANKEENRRRAVEELEAAGVRVFVTYARTVREAVHELGFLGALTATEAQAARIVALIEAARQRARGRHRGAPARVAALIWKNPYMAVGGDTFAHDLLVQCGGRNPFAESESRYPRIDAAALEAAAPEVILLPTEPYAFGEADRLELLELDCPAARNGRIHVIEGELLSWYGPRLERALDEISALLQTSSTRPAQERRRS